jgi:Integrase core domain
MANYTPNTAGTSPYVPIPTIPSSLAKPPIQALKGRNIDNVWIERFFRTIKYEYVYLNPSQDGSELYRSVNTFVNYYNHRRKHSSLGYQTPASVYYGQSDEKWTQGMGNHSICLAASISKP